MKKLLIFTFFMAALGACGGGKSGSASSASDSDSVVTDSIISIEGTWIQPSGDSIKGFILKENNMAEAINMPNMKMRSWSQTDDSLTIEATLTIGDSVMPQVVSYKIEKLKADTLVLHKGDNISAFSRKR